jgi:hypothetical protein
VSGTDGRLLELVHVAMSYVEDEEKAGEVDDDVEVEA